jgi:CheY-like chemotaxis protein
MEILPAQDQSADRVLALSAMANIGFTGATHIACDGWEAIASLQRRGKDVNLPPAGGGQLGLGPKTEAVTAHEMPATSATILLVEDDASIRLIAKLHLEGSGYTVLEAVDGVAALAMWQKHRDTIDLVLTDFVLPRGLNGQELVRAIQVDRPDMQVIYVSGHSEDQFGEEVLRDSTTNFLQKPYRLKNLAEMVQHCLAGSEAA